ncbi:TIGR02117 family protein [Sphingomicrobium flavum]|uniref:TIGR02117 family protein n=1 Tax=Sphingomicrobium flavum TaxID=1229164 RepID=UPI0021ADCCE2|nr:TIGR02117 family protein [Sphingomicrobium flavum]
MARRKTSPTRKLVWRSLLVLLAIPLIYLLFAGIGSLIPMNSDWEEPDEGVTIYIANNGVHLDLVVPTRVQGLDWSKDFLPTDIGNPAAFGSDWVMIGAGDKAVYLDTPTWGDLTVKTAFNAATQGDRVMHVQWVTNPQGWTQAELRLRPEEYRRLYAAMRSTFSLSDGKPVQLDHPGYFGSDAFYEGLGSFTLTNTCNQWVASRLRIAGVETSLWSPLAQGLPWRYRTPPR